MRERIYGAESLSCADSCRYLANALTGLGDHTQAQQLYERALAIHRHLGDIASSDYISCLNNFGAFLHKRHEYQKAEPFVREHLNLAEKQYGIAHPDFALALHCHAAIQAELNNGVEAERAALRALQILQQHFGVNHPETVSTRINLARLLPPARAEPIARRALWISTREATANREATLEHEQAKATYESVLRALKLRTPEIARRIASAERELAPEEIDSSNL